MGRLRDNSLHDCLIGEIFSEDTIKYSLNIRPARLKLRENFFYPGVLMQIPYVTNISRQGRVVVNFCLDYLIEQSNLLRENIIFKTLSQTAFLNLLSQTYCMNEF